MAKATPRAGIARGEIKKVKSAYDNGVPAQLVAKGMKVPLKCIQSFYDHFKDPSILGEKHAKIAKDSKTEAFLKKEKEAMDNILAKESAEKKLKGEKTEALSEDDEKALLEKLQKKYKIVDEDDLIDGSVETWVEDPEPGTPEWDALSPTQKGAITRKRNAAAKE